MRSPMRSFAVCPSTTRISGSSRICVDVSVMRKDAVAPGIVMLYPLLKICGSVISWLIVAAGFEVGLVIPVVGFVVEVAGVPGLANDAEMLVGGVIPTLRMRSRRASMMATWITTSGLALSIS